MNGILSAYAMFLIGMRYALFVAAVVVAVVALVDWAVRTRRLNPFGPVARFCRRVVDPVMAPIERRVVLAGGLPQNAPWWTLVAIVVGGLLLMYLLNFVFLRLVDVSSATQATNETRAILSLLVNWVFGILRIALIVRVVSSWFRLSPFSPWIRWSFVLTEWMIAPLRRFIPPFGMVDVTPLIAYFALSLIQGAIRI